MENDKNNVNAASESDADRRRFLATCGRFAVVTLPVLTTLMSTGLTSQAIAKSGGGPRGGGKPGNPGNGGGKPDNPGRGHGPSNPGNNPGKGH